MGHLAAEAAAAIGQVCQGDECEDFAEMVGKAHFDIMTTGFDQILFYDAICREPATTDVT